MRGIDAEYCVDVKFLWTFLVECEYCLVAAEAI